MKNLTEKQKTYEITTKLPEDLNTALKLYKIRIGCVRLQEALIDALRNFFTNDKYDYMLEERK